jgi:hypothetical protein
MADVEREAGPRLDAEISERVFGVKAKPMYGSGSWHEVSGHRNPVKRYSSDVAAAWQIVPIMGGKGYWFRLDNIDSEGYWSALFSNDLQIFSDYTGESAETAPLAICLAALAALAQAPVPR